MFYLQVHGTGPVQTASSRPRPLRAPSL